MPDNVSKPFREVFLICVFTPDGKWTRIGKPYLKKEIAHSWVPVVKAAWHGMRTRTKRVRVPLVDGKPTAAAVKRFSDEFQIDLS